MRPLRAQGFDHLEQVGERAGEAVDARHDERVAPPHPGQGGGGLRAGVKGAGGEFLEHLLAAGGTERVQLWAEVLVVGGDAGVADQGHG